MSCSISRTVHPPFTLQIYDRLTISEIAMLNFFRFLDSDYFPSGVTAVLSKKTECNLSRTLPFVVLHLSCLSVFLTGWSPFALYLAISLYFIRMFFVTGFYHRYFSHKTYKTSRVAQAIFAALGTTAVQRGPLWWAAHHRVHHKLADKEGDVHSPVRSGFLWSHIGWMTSDCYMPTDYSKVGDLVRYPELHLINRFDWFFPILMGIAVYCLGEFVGKSHPDWHTNGWQCVSWGIVSTVVLFHATAAINSLAHTVGSQPYSLEDNSRNNFFLALVTMGEGWHNNHHRYPTLVRQGLEWWQIDLTFYLLAALAKLGVIWDLRCTPQSHTETAVFEPQPGTREITVANSAK